MSQEQETAMYDQPELPIDEIDDGLIEEEEALRIHPQEGNYGIPVEDTLTDEEIERRRKKQMPKKERKLRKRVPPTPRTIMRHEMVTASNKLAEMYRLEEQAGQIMREATDLKLTYVQWIGVRDLVIQALRGGSSGVAKAE